MERITNTSTKLEEAKYFLARMTAEVTNREPFKYNLSAFLSAARSVTFIMQKEFSEKPGFPEWYEQKQNQMRNDLFIKLMNEMRVETIHRAPIDPKGDIKITINTTGVITDQVVAIIKHKDGSEERKEYGESPPSSDPKSSVETEYRWHFESIPGIDIMKLSQDHMRKLETLVVECEMKFSSKLAKDA